MIAIPEFNPKFYYGPVVSHEFRDVSKDKGKYRVRIYITFQNGFQTSFQKGGFVTKREANRAYSQIAHDIIEGSFSPFQFTIQEVAEYWLYEICLKEKKLAYNTIISYRNIIYNYLLKKFNGKRKLNSFKEQELVKFLLSFDGSSLRRCANKIVTGIFSFAFKKGYIQIDTGSIAVNKVLKMNPYEEKKRNYIWSVEEIQYALSTAKERFPNLYMPLLLSITLGTRVSETIGLKYSDIDYNAQTIIVQRQLNRKLDLEDKVDSFISVRSGETGTKSINGVRELPLPKFVLDEIICARKRYENNMKRIQGFEDYDYICCKITGELFHRASMNRDFNQLKKCCNFDPDFHWHDLRHTYATLLSTENGSEGALNMKAISLFLGHSSEDFSELVYVKDKPLPVRDCSEIMEEFYEFAKGDDDMQSECINIENDNLLSFLPDMD